MEFANRKYDFVCTPKLNIIYSFGTIIRAIKKKYIVECWKEGSRMGQFSSLFFFIGTGTAVFSFNVIIF